MLGLTQLGLDLLRVPDLLEEYALCVILSVTAVDNLGDVRNEWEKMEENSRRTDARSWWVP
jgi:hypothetical protein